MFGIKMFITPCRKAGRYFFRMIAEPGIDPLWMMPGSVVNLAD